MSNELAKQISYILYGNPEEDVKVMALIKDETIWLTQKATAKNFFATVQNKFHYAIRENSLSLEKKLDSTLIF